MSQLNNICYETISTFDHVDEQEDEKAPNFFPVYGVPVKFIQNTFIKTICKGRDKLIGKSTFNVCEEIVKPFTLESKSSFCRHMMKKSSKAGIGKADVFISHAWKYMFLDVVDALVAHFKDEPDAIIWFDIFSVNQHTSNNKTFDWWSSTFQEAIRKFGRTVMILLPWHDPVPLTRAWCLWELYSTIITDVKFEVAFSPSEYDNFLHTMMVAPEQSINQMKAKINVENSSAQNDIDRQQIFQAIQKRTTFDKLNNIVFQCLEKWVLETLINRLTYLYKKSLPSTAVETIMKAGEYVAKQIKSTVPKKKNKASHDESHPNHAKSEEHVFVSIENLQEGPLMKDVLIMTSVIGLVFQNQGDYKNAKLYHTACYERCRALLPENDPLTLDALENLASIHEHLSDYQQARPLYEDSYKFRMAQDGQTNLLHTINGLGSCALHMNEFDKAFQLYQKGLGICKELLSEHDTMTLTLRSNLAISNKMRGKDIDEAFQQLLSCFEKCKELFGGSHPDTLRALYNVGNMEFCRGNVTEAEQQLGQCIDAYITIFGPNHPDIIHPQLTLAHLHLHKQEFGTAIKKYEECYEKTKALLGEDHEKTHYVFNCLEKAKNISGYDFKAEDTNDNNKLHNSSS